MRPRTRARVLVRASSRDRERDTVPWSTDVGLHEMWGNTVNDDKLRALASGTRFADLEVRRAVLRVLDERDELRLRLDGQLAFGEGKQ